MMSQVVGEPLVCNQRLVDGLLVDHSHREQRDHGDHRAHPDRDRVTIGQLNAVVEHTVAIVPGAHCLQCIGDAGEVLKELLHQIERGSLPRPVQDGRNCGHRQRVPRHPPGGVGLLEDAPDGKVGSVQGADVVQPHEPALE